MPIVEKIKIILADEQECFKKGLKLSLEKSSTVDVVGEASTEEQLVNIIAEKQPHVVLIDAHIVNLDSVAFIRRYAHHTNAIRFIILSQYETESLISSSIAAGAGGYVSKDAASDEIVTAIEEVYQGNTYYSKRIALKIFKLFEEHGNGRPSRNKQQLTEIEKLIVEEICSELTNKEIADKLCLSVRTVEGHRLHILKKIQAKGTAGIVVYAIKHGLYKMQWKISK